MKLYRVTLRGMTSSIGGAAYGISYVVADNTDMAYSIVKGVLDKEDIGFTTDRALDKVELIAEEGLYAPCRTVLYMQEGKKC